MPRLKFNVIPFLVVAGAFFVAVVLGLGANILPWWLLLPLATLPVLAAIGFRYPPVFLASAFLMILLLPLYKVQDVLFFGLCVVGAVIAARAGNLYLHHWVVKLVFVICLVAALSATIGYVVNGNGLEAVYNEARVFMYWLACPLVLLFFNKDDGGRSITFAILAVGGILALIAALQGMLGVSLLGTGRIAALDTSGRDALAGTVTRVQIAGFPIIQAALLLLWADLVSKANVKVWKLLLFAVLLLAIYYNFGRAVWVWTAFAMLGVALFYGGRGILVVSVCAALGVAAALVIEIYANPVALEVAVDRILSIGAEGGYGTSYGWRELENSAAISAILNTYGLGVGLGGEYRDFYIPLRHFPDHVRYIHQGHFGLMLKVSVFGWLLIMMFLTAVCIAAYYKWRREGGSNPSLLALAAVIFCFILLNNTQPVFMSYDGTLATALVLALFVSIAKTSQAQKR